MSRYRPAGNLKMEQIEALYQGSIDMHVHTAPDPSCARRMDAVEAALAAEQGGMRAIVTKSFFYPTTVAAQAAMHAVESVQVFGSVTIGYGTTGGLDYAAETLENHAKMGCKVVWLPASDAAYCRRGMGQTGGICILTEDGRLKRAAVDVLEVARSYGLVVCKGHLSYEETEALFAEAVRMGITKLVVTHPLADTWGYFTAKQIHKLADMGAYIEHVFGCLMPRLNSVDPADYVDMVRAIGAERSIMSSDLAQCMDPTPPEGMRFFIGTMLQFGCTEEEVAMMVKTNPARLLDLE